MDTKSVQCHSFFQTAYLVETYRGHDLHSSRSLDVIGGVTILFAICYFLLAVHWNRASTSECFRDIRLPRVVHAYTNKQTDTYTHTNAKSDLYFVPCNVLHWKHNSTLLYSYAYQ